MPSLRTWLWVWRKTQGKEGSRHMEGLYDIVAGMISKSRNAWPLVKASCSVLNRDRELLILTVFPLVGIVAIIVLSLGLIQYAFTSAFVALIIFTALLLIMIVSVSCEGALVAGAYERMMGGDPTVRSSVKAAWKHIHTLIEWVFVMVFAGFLRNIIGSLALHLATYFVVPVIVIESKGPIAGLKRSVSLIRKTWGENLIANAGFELLTFLLCLPSFGIGIVGIGLWLAGSTPDRAVIGIVTVFGWFVVVRVFVSAISIIFQTALYVYAVTDKSSTTDASFMGFEKVFLAESIVSKTETNMAETYQPVLEPPTTQAGDGQAGDGNDTDEEHQSEDGEDNTPLDNDSN